MELIITNRKNNWFDKFFLGIIIIMSAITLISYIENVSLKQHFFIVTIVFTIITKLFYFFYYLNKKPFEELGKVVFSKDDIFIQENLINQRFRYEDLEYLKLEINQTSLDKNFKSDLNRKKDGDMNFIEIKQVDGTYFKFNAYIENAEKIKEIDDFVNNSHIEKLKLLRQGKVVKSILEWHYKDYPKERFNTSGKRYYKNEKHNTK